MNGTWSITNFLECMKEESSIPGQKERKGTKKASSGQISNWVLRYQAWISWFTTFLHDRRDRSPSRKRSRQAIRVRVDVVVLRRLSFSEASLVLSYWRMGMLKRNCGRRFSSGMTHRCLNSIIIYLFIYLFIWSTPPSSQQKAIIKGYYYYGDCAGQVNAPSRFTLRRVFVATTKARKKLNKIH